MGILSRPSQSHPLLPLPPLLSSLSFSLSLSLSLPLSSSLAPSPPPPLLLLHLPPPPGPWLFSFALIFFFWSFPRFQFAHSSICHSKRAGYASFQSSDVAAVYWLCSRRLTCFTIFLRFHHILFFCSGLKLSLSLAFNHLSIPSFIFFSFLLLALNR